MATRELTSLVVTQLQGSPTRPAFFFEGIFGSGTIRVWTGDKDIVLENQFLWSNFLEDVWPETRATVTYSDGTGPTGIIDAASLIENTATNTHYCEYDHGGSPPLVDVTSGTQYRFSVFLKANGRNWAELHMGTAGFGTDYAYFDLSGGAVGTTGANLDQATIEDFGSGWYLCTCTGTSDATTDSNKPFIFLADADNSNSYTGDGSSGIYFWGPNFNAATSDAVYVETGQGPAPTNPPHTYLGDGVLYSITPPSEVGEIAVPGIRIGLSGVPASYRSVILNNNNNHSEGTLWFAVMDDNWVPYSNMYKLFSGYLNGATVTETGNQTIIVLPFESRLSGLKRRRERRYTDANQQLRYPGDLGMQYVNQAQQWTGYWGKDNDRTLANFRRRDTR